MASQKDSALIAALRREIDDFDEPANEKERARLVQLIHHAERLEAGNATPAEQATARADLHPSEKSKLR
jgi:hypothetical protein